MSIGDDEWVNNDHSHDRGLDRYFSLTCPMANLPSIAFCNTGDDPEGRWLIACNISGLIMIWDLQNKTVIKTFSVHFQVSDTIRKRDFGFGADYAGQLNASTCWLS